MKNGLNLWDTAFAYGMGTSEKVLASGRLSRKPGDNDTKRGVEDAYAKFKYDATAEQDGLIINRVAELA